MKTLKNIIAISLLSATASNVTHISAASPANKGLEIAKEADQRDSGWLDRSAIINMTLRNAQGDERKRIIRNLSLEVEGDGDKSLTIFDEPKDIKGTAFLSFTHATRADDQWIYLPAIKRVKRISSGNKSGPFMGSEFAYEDLSSQEVSKFEYKFLREEKFEKKDCYVVERIPQYKHSGYTRLLAWIDKETYQDRKVEYYDKKDSLLKTLVLSNYQMHLNKYWRPNTMTMENHQTGKSTVLDWQDYKFQNGLDARNFNKNALKRLR